MLEVPAAVVEAFSDSKPTPGHAPPRNQTFSLWRSGIRRDWTKLLAKAGLPHMRVHDLRHTTASLLLAEGVPVKVASEMLGHSDVTTTRRIYAHVIEGAQEQAASAMDMLFHG